MPIYRTLKGIHIVIAGHQIVHFFLHVACTKWIIWTHNQEVMFLCPSLRSHAAASSKLQNEFQCEIWSWWLHNPMLDEFHFDPQMVREIPIYTEFNTNLSDDLNVIHFQNINTWFVLLSDSCLHILLKMFFCVVNIFFEIK
jgi:hypothetical protein